MLDCAFPMLHPATLHLAARSSLLPEAQGAFRGPALSFASSPSAFRLTPPRFLDLRSAAWPSALGPGLERPLPAPPDAPAPPRNARIALRSPTAGPITTPPLPSQLAPSLQTASCAPHGRSSCPLLAPAPLYSLPPPSNRLDRPKTTNDLGAILSSLSSVRSLPALPFLTLSSLYVRNGKRDGFRCVALRALPLCYVALDRSGDGGESGM